MNRRTKGYARSSRRSEKRKESYGRERILVALIADRWVRMQFGLVAMATLAAE